MNLQSNTVSIKLPRGDQASFEEMQAYGNALQDVYMPTGGRTGTH